jgi:hypothetical protein
MQVEKVTPGPGYLIQEKGVFNSKKLFSEIKAWLAEHHYKFNETKRKHKKGDFGDIIELIWIAERPVTEYIKFSIEINFVLEDLNPAGEGLVSGKAEMLIGAKATIDFRNEWEPTKMRKFIMGWYQKLFLQDNINKYVDKLDAEIKDLRGTIKEVFDFYR